MDPVEFHTFLRLNPGKCVLVELEDGTHIRVLDKVETISYLDKLPERWTKSIPFTAIKSIKVVRMPKPKASQPRQ